MAKNKERKVLKRCVDGISQETIVKAINEILNEPFWLPGLETQVAYQRIHDDHDGTFDGILSVVFGKDSDAWLQILGKPGVILRFRNSFGGGQSQRVRNALLILAHAIKLDNEEVPQYSPQE
jgi:hypothetical protein